LRSGRRSFSLLLILLLAGLVPVRAQLAAVPGDMPQAVPDDESAMPSTDPRDQSPKDMIGSRWPVLSDDDTPPIFVTRTTDRLSEAMREVQAEQEAATKEAEADARTAEQTSPRASRFARYHGRGKRLAARGRTTALHAAAKGKKIRSKPSVKRQASKGKAGRHHRA
jgi:hypothetical protein